jgi:hypothetical protein
MLLIAILTLGSTWLAQLATPQLVGACTCARANVAKFVGNPAYTILLGVVRQVQMRDDGTQTGTLAIERIFQGAIAAPAHPVSASNMCMDSLSEGMQLIAVGVIDAGTFRPNPCGPMGDLREAWGQDVMADVRANLGNGWAPGQQPPDRAPDKRSGLAIAALGAAGLAVGVVAVAVVLSAVRRRDALQDPPS